MRVKVRVKLPMWIAIAGTVFGLALGGFVVYAVNDPEMRDALARRVFQFARKRDGVSGRGYHCRLRIGRKGASPPGWQRYWYNFRCEATEPVHFSDVAIRLVPNEGPPPPAQATDGSDGRLVLVPADAPAAAGPGQPFTRMGETRVALEALGAGREGRVVLTGLATYPDGAGEPERFEWSREMELVLPRR